MVKKVVKAFIIILIVISMMGNGKMIRKMGMENYFLIMEIYTMENGYFDIKLG